VNHPASNNPIVAMAVNQVGNGTFRNPMRHQLLTFAVSCVVFSIKSPTPLFLPSQKNAALSAFSISCCARHSRRVNLLASRAKRIPSPDEERGEAMGNDLRVISARWRSKDIDIIDNADTPSLAITSGRTEMISYLGKPSCCSANGFNFWRSSFAGITSVVLKPRGALSSSGRRTNC